MRCRREGFRTLAGRRAPTPRQLVGWIVLIVITTGLVAALAMRLDSGSWIDLTVTSAVILCAVVLLSRLA